MNPDELVHHPWRPGGKVGRTVYAVIGDTPGDDDVLIGLFDSSLLAAVACHDHNLAVGVGDPSHYSRPETRKKGLF